MLSVQASDSVGWNRLAFFREGGGRGGPPSPERDTSSNRVNLVICNDNFSSTVNKVANTEWHSHVVNNEHAPEITFVCYV